MSNLFKIQTLLILFILFAATEMYGQEKPTKKNHPLNPEVEMNPEERFNKMPKKEDFKQQRPNQPGAKSKSSSNKRRGKKKGASSGSLVIEHQKKEDKFYSYESGKELKVLVKKDNQKVKGALEKSNAKSVTINGEEYSKKDIIWVNKTSKYKSIQALKRKPDNWLVDLLLLAVVSG